MSRSEEAKLLNLKRLPSHKNAWTIRASEHPGAPWPQKTSICCWWCRHPFETVPVPLPIRYDPRLDAFFTKGMFCSWSCAKAFNWSQNADMDAGLRSELLFLLKKRTTRNMHPITVAVHWSKLKMFGGHLSIEDFRKNLDTVDCPMSSKIVSSDLTTSVIPLNMREIKNMNSASAIYSTTTTPSTSKQRMVNFDDISTNKNETLRLKRNKPLPGSNSNILEKILGISSKT